MIIKDPGTYDYNLFIKNATTEQNVEFICAENAYAAARVAANVYVIDVIPTCTVDPGLTVIENEDVEFLCEIRLDPDAPGDLVWYTDGIESARDSSPINEWITRLTKSDNGASMNCRLEHFTLPEVKWSEVSCEHNLVMNVQYAHEVHILDDTNGFVFEGDDYMATCDIKQPGNPPEVTSTKWIFNDNTISNDAVLTLSEIERKEAGNYTCVMTNTFYNGNKGEGTATIQVHVQYLASVNITTSPNNVTEGDRVEIHCSAYGGDPGVNRINLIFNGDIIDGTSETDLTHTIDSICRTQSGTYQCRAITEFFDGIERYSTADTNITVQYAPQITEFTENAEAVNGGDAVLECTVDSVPTAYVEWYDPTGVLIENDERRNITSDTEGPLSTSTLTITSVGDDDFGNYTCKATNWIPPSDERTIELREGESVSSLSVGAIVFVSLIAAACVAGVLVYVFYTYKKKDKSKDMNDLQRSLNAMDTGRTDPEGGTYDHEAAINPYVESSELPNDDVPTALYAQPDKSKKKKSPLEQQITDVYAQPDKKKKKSEPITDVYAQPDKSAKKKKTDSKAPTPDSEYQVFGGSKPDKGQTEVDSNPPTVPKKPLKVSADELTYAELDHAMKAGATRKPGTYGAGSTQATEYASLDHLRTAQQKESYML